MPNFKNSIFIALALILSFLIIIITPQNSVKQPKKVYRVYLAGKSVGLITDKNSLDKYIDNEQKTLKEKYNADKIYAPADLKIVSDITYDEKIDTTKEIYNKITHNYFPALII